MLLKDKFKQNFDQGMNVSFKVLMHPLKVFKYKGNWNESFCKKYATRK